MQLENIIKAVKQQFPNIEFALRNTDFNAIVKAFAGFDENILLSKLYASIPIAINQHGFDVKKIQPGELSISLTPSAAANGNDPNIESTVVVLNLDTKGMPSTSYEVELSEHKVQVGLSKEFWARRRLSGVAFPSIEKNPEILSNANVIMTDPITNNVASKSDKDKTKNPQKQFKFEFSILVVDDTSSIRYSLTTIFESKWRAIAKKYSTLIPELQDVGVKVVAVETGEKGRSELENEKVNWVLISMDEELKPIGKFNGVETIKMIRQDSRPYLHIIPIIMCSSKDPQELTEATKGLNVCRVFEKKLKASEFEKLLEERCLPIINQIVNPQISWTDLIKNSTYGTIVQTLQANIPSQTPEVSKIGNDNAESDSKRLDPKGPSNSNQNMAIVEITPSIEEMVLPAKRSASCLEIGESAGIWQKPSRMRLDEVNTKEMEKTDVCPQNLPNIQSTFPYMLLDENNTKGRQSPTRHMSC